MAVGAVEPHFYHEFVTLLGLDPDEVGQFDDFDEMKLIIQKRFKERTQEDWCKVVIVFLSYIHSTAPFLELVYFLDMIIVHAFFMTVSKWHC